MEKKCCSDSDKLSMSDSPFDIITPESDNATESCCGIPVLKNPKTTDPENENWTIGKLETSVGQIHKIRTHLNWTDKIATWKVRWGMNRMGYTIRPGIYAVGNPDQNSDIFVSANYKMSFDRLRQNLNGVDGWLLVIDTKGVNVWCAAGKGTFGTAELINRIKLTRLGELTKNRRLIVPQLGAPGVSGFEVKAQTGFRVKFGPVRAEDLPEYLKSGKVATKEMRRVRFPFKERLVLAPVEIVSLRKYLLGLSVFFALFGGFAGGSFSIENIMSNGLLSVIFLISGFLAGTFLGPILLPWLPGRSFSSKGAWAGALVLIVIGLWAYNKSVWPDGLYGSLSWLFLIPAIASFATMNFTGSSTYTSFSGVMKEMHVAVRLQAAFTIIGLGLWLTGRFI